MSAPMQTPIPGASSYASADVMANNAYNAALAQLNQNRLNTLTQYGYTGNIDPTSGVLSGVRVNPDAVHGQLQDLLHNQAVEDIHATTAAQDRHLIGGLAHQAGSELHFQHGSQDTQFGESLAQQLADYQDTQQQDAETRDNALWQAENDAANQAVSDQEQQTIDQLVQSLGDPSAVKQPKPAPASSSGPAPKAKPRVGKNHPQRGKAVKRILKRGRR